MNYIFKEGIRIEHILSYNLRYCMKLFLIKYTLISLCGGGGLTGMSSELSRWNIFISFILSFDIYTP